MDKYEIERTLGQKADKWQVHNLETQNTILNHKINELERKISDLESQNIENQRFIENVKNALINLNF